MAEPSPFGLLDLPPELWIRICRLIVEDWHIIHVHQNMDHSRSLKTIYQPAITRTCRIIRGEILKYFYANNRFEVHCTWRWPNEHPAAWLSCIGPKNYTLIRSCRICTHAHDYVVWNKVKELDTEDARILLSEEANEAEQEFARFKDSLKSVGLQPDIVEDEEPAAFEWRCVNYRNHTNAKHRFRLVESEPLATQDEASVTSV